MEQHPVPQNVTTFQFRLIGDMTLKQFGYLCAGGVLAIISYKLPLPFFFTWPLAAGFALLGVGFAFVPIEERPMDVWVFSFFKSIYSPTQYIWKKGQAPTIPVATNVSIPPVSASVVSATRPQNLTPSSSSPLPSVAHIYAPATQGAPTPTVASIHKSQSVFDQLFGFFSPRKKSIPSTHLGVTPQVQQSIKSVTGMRPETSTAVKPAAQPTPTVDNHKIQELEKAVAALQLQLSTKNVADDRILELQKQLSDALNEKSRVDDELVRLKRQSEKPSHQEIAQQTPQEKPNTETTKGVPTVRPFSSVDAGVRSGIPRFTSIPNVITGIVKDDAGGFLPAILITVTNADGIPMRALKTNKLGQLAASTPLPNGVYVIEIEDPRGRFTFDRAQVTLNGSVVPALEIIAKSQKQVSRDKIAQDIFGKPPM